MYYGDSDATTTASSKWDVFNYTTPKPIYYTVSNHLAADDIFIVSFKDNNTIILDGNEEVINVSRAETGTFTNANNDQNSSSSL